MSYREKRHKSERAEGARRNQSIRRNLDRRYEKERR